MSKNVEGLVEMDSQVHAVYCTMVYLVHILLLTVGVLTRTVIFQGNLRLLCQVTSAVTYVLKHDCGCQQEICKEPAMIWMLLKMKTPLLNLFVQLKKTTRYTSGLNCSTT